MRIQNSRARKRINWIVTSPNQPNNDDAQRPRPKSRYSRTNRYRYSQAQLQIQIQVNMRRVDLLRGPNRTELGRKGNGGKGKAGMGWEQWPSAINVISFDSIKVRPQKTNCELRLRLCRQQQSESGTGNWQLRAGNESAQSDPVEFDIVGNRCRDGWKSVKNYNTHQQKIELCLI